MEFFGTLGGTCTEYRTLVELFQAGMTGARLNLSHTELSDCASLLEEVYWPAARTAGTAASLLIDLQGPELRVGTLAAPISLSEGACITLGGSGIPIPQAVVDCARRGHTITLDDRSLELEVQSNQGTHLLCRVVRGGVLRSRKSLAILGESPAVPTLTATDLENLRHAARFGVTHVLQPFVRGREDLQILRSSLNRLGLEQVQIVAKIENQVGLEHLEEIIQEADILCIARGDLGNHLPLWRLPSIQKDIAARCRRANRPFLVVTQLLHSMEERAVPTRAEVCDIYNAVLDGAWALMLTGETAAGRYPVQAMDYLVKTAKCALEDLCHERTAPER